jgi:hypothetical protein
MSREFFRNLSKDNTMKRFIFVLVLIIVGVACLGFYLSWFRIGSETTDGKTHITLTVDQNKIKADENKALEKVHGSAPQGTEPQNTR